jgi:hypothetical protein
MDLGLSTIGAMMPNDPSTPTGIPCHLAYSIVTDFVIHEGIEVTPYSTF